MKAGIICVFLAASGAFAEPRDSQPVRPAADNQQPRASMADRPAVKPIPVTATPEQVVALRTALRARLDDLRH